MSSLLELVVFTLYLQNAENSIQRNVKYGQQRLHSWRMTIHIVSNMKTTDKPIKFIYYDIIIDNNDFMMLNLVLAFPTSLVYWGTWFYKQNLICVCLDHSTFSMKTSNILRIAKQKIDYIWETCWHCGSCCYALSVFLDE